MKKFICVMLAVLMVSSVPAVGALASDELPAVNDKVLVLSIGSKEATVFGEDKENDVEPIKNGRTYTPVRFIAEGLGSQVKWDEETQSVLITRPGEKFNPVFGTMDIINLEYFYEEGGEIVEYNEDAVIEEVVE